MPKTMICAHRGLDDSAPENTLAAFVAALEREMAIEFDIQVTADRQLVVVHDGTVDRTTDGSGQISQLSLADVKALDAGSWFGPHFAGEGVPTFDEVLELVSRYRHVSPSIALDVKNPPPDIIGMICNCLTRHQLVDDVIGIGAIIRSAEVRRQFCEASSQFRCAVVAETAADVDAALEDEHSTWVYARFVPSPDDVCRISQGGKKLIVCGSEVSRDVNRAHDAYKAGPDMVLTSHPSRLAELVT
ncbi:glycerophosphodiester phosphodiesterase [Candidatus Latescibacterota bacterium]